MRLIDSNLLDEAALRLLTSSTARRYMREATRLAASSRLADSIRKDEAVLTRVLDRWTELAGKLRTQTERTADEFEAALLLCVLAKSAAPSGLEVVEMAVNASEIGSPWLAALAARLQELGPPNPRDLEELMPQLDALPQQPITHSESLDELDRKDYRTSFPRAA